ncbi:hypothetical protein [Flavobacterium sp. AG291]|uniref:hypothetical protein n=1 Tax=Flavobacterium sp. AG291 TaxID=2184000 RepID=UPI000E0C2213|nr:hypothetical protein [Flavobacterium sp. AG291]
MKKLCVYILIFLVNLNTSFFEELLKVPVLVQHFMEHQQRNADIGFGEFLAQHYGSRNTKDNDEDRDMQLPYKKLDHHDVTHFVFLPNRFYSSSVRITPMDSPVDNHYKNNFLHNPHLGALFRPPIA